MKVRSAALLAGTLAIGAGAASFAGLRPGSGKKHLDYRTAPVERGTLEARVTASGTFSALVTVQVGSQVSGRIAELLADFDTPVRRGQPIARLDPRLLKAEVEQAQATCAATAGKLEKGRVRSAAAERKLARAKELRAQQLIAESELESAQFEADAAKADADTLAGELRQAQAALHQTQINLDSSTIVSPIDGVVISRSVDVGQTVAASLQAPVLFTIAQDLKRMQVNASVAEADVGKIAPGMVATFAVDAFPGERFEGRIRQIRNAAQTLQNVVTYDAIIDVANQDLKLRPGMSANVTVIWARREGALTVPNAALRFRPPTKLLARSRRPGAAEAGTAQAAPAPDQRTIWVLREGAPRPVTVRVGLSDGARTEILEGGLAEGDQVVVDALGPAAGASSKKRGLF
jgi:HlyD family secretion protein